MSVKTMLFHLQKSLFLLVFKESAFYTNVPHMTVEQLEKAYEAAKYEEKIYKEWEDAGAFNPDTLTKKRKESFTIAMPPPNVTGQLHMGHAAMLAIEDLMVRFERMRGKKALWVPGLDHASIATQNVVEKKIWKEEKKTRHDLGREEFLKRVDVFVQESKNVIRTQIKKMGASCDWSRERYTLDEGLSRAVRTMFVRMYEDGLIYRGNRIVNWCTRCASTLADDEVNYREERSRFYYLKYGPVVIGTARPETKFLDKVIVVHPDDTRYMEFVGKKFDVEWIDGKVQASVVADAIVDPAMGTGAMTITPAHSFEDFLLAQKYGFAVHQIIGMDGKMTEAAGGMAGMPVAECRAKVVERLQQKGLIDHIDENYVHNLSVCYRCDTPIQPLVSKQWFVAVDKKPKNGGKSLKARSIDAVRKEKITIVPDRFNKTYFQWMDNLHDWCISRQLWFGHRIPVWYCKGNQESGIGNHGTEKSPNSLFIIHDSKTCPPIVQIDPIKACPSCGSKELEQDPDTLDTWFSAGLWTFSTLGWPMNQSQSSGSGHATKKNDLQTFHPTSVMETGYDILFFWVARMIMMTTYALDEVPFKTVYLHGLVRDKFGKKMSKSKGNGIDPLDMIAKYGADAVRLSLIIGGTPGNDVRLYDEKIAGFRNFVNKLWNIGRFVLSQPSSSSERSESRSSLPAGRQVDQARTITLADRWILSRLQRVIVSVTDDCAQFRFSQAGERLRDFTWGDFADWYLEIKKIEGDPNDFLLSTFDFLLRLWHPYTPYVTEVLWEHLHETCNMKRETLLILAEWPKSEKKYIDIASENAFALLQKSVMVIRNARAIYRIPAATKLNVMIAARAQFSLFAENQSIIARLANLASCTVTKEAERPNDAVPLSVGKSVIYLLVGGIVDVVKEQERIKGEIEKQMAYVSNLEKKLSNEEFTKKAPAEIVEQERAKWEVAREELERLREFLA
ncbi:MAG: valine--tRNA ligase [bacterium]|nr:valine--tRNA ligase [bacterium]